MTPLEPNRRKFLQAGVAAGAALGLSEPVAAQAPRRNDAGIPLRKFGRTDEMVSALALGGHSSTNPNKLTEVESLRLIQRAVDEGITFMDNGWDYHDGVAEERMGKALAEGNAATRSSS